MERERLAKARHTASSVTPGRFAHSSERTILMVDDKKVQSMYFRRWSSGARRWSTYVNMHTVQAALFLP